MSNSYNPQQGPGQGTEPWSQSPQAGQHGHTQSQQSNSSGGFTRLPLFLLISVGVLVLLTIGVIVMLFVGGSEGNGTRGIWTFIAFGFFVGFTALDTSRKNMANWYLPAALFVNTYILAITLIVTWVTKVPEYDAMLVLGFSIFWTLFVTVILMRLLLLACEILQGRHQIRPKIVNILALASTVLIIVVGFLFTLPLAFSAFEVRLGDLYWKFTISVLVLAALALSIYVLLVWQFREEILRSAPGRTGLFLSRKLRGGGQPVPANNVRRAPDGTFVPGPPPQGGPQHQVPPANHAGPSQAGFPQQHGAPVGQPYGQQSMQVPPANAFGEPPLQQPFPQQPTGNFVPADEPRDSSQQERPEPAHTAVFETQTNDLGQQDQSSAREDHEPPFAVRSTGSHSASSDDAPEDAPAHAEPSEAPVAPEPVADALADQEPEVFGAEEPASAGADHDVDRDELSEAEPATPLEQLIEDVTEPADDVAGQSETAAPVQESVPQQPEPNEDGLLPWPTFADGTPIPPRPDGQPDFSVPGAPKPPHLQ